MIELSMLEDLRSHLRRHRLAIANQTRSHHGRRIYIILPAHKSYNIRYTIALAGKSGVSRNQLKLKKLLGQLARFDFGKRSYPRSHFALKSLIRKSLFASGSLLTRLLQLSVTVEV
jgi:hypothetical protein